MYSFQNDYSEGMQPAILRALETINYHQNHSYGQDIHSDAARDYILSTIFRKH
jgi:threonine aldolase